MGILLAMMMLGVIGPLLMGEDEPTGTEESDRIESSDEGAALQGAGGADLLLGAIGDDTIAGGAGDDWIFAGGGDDTITGDDGGDVILPDAGADTVASGAGDDFIESADLVDDAVLQESLETARSFADIRFTYDFAAAPDGGDSIDAGAGDDTVVAGPADTITGGAGADEVAVGDWGRGAPPVEIADFDPEEDVLTYTYRAGNPAPTLTATTDPASGDVTLLADGEPAVILRGLPSGFDPARVTVKLWRAAA